MYQHAHYDHPPLQPYFRGSWMEVLYSWGIALGIVAGILLAM